MWTLALLLVLLVPPSSFTHFDAVARVLWIAACAWFIIRSLFVGAYVGKTRLVLVGWFWVYRIPRTEIDEFVTRAYDGLITRGSDRNIFSSRVRSLGVSIAFDRVRYFNSIAMPNRTSKGVIDDLTHFAIVPPGQLPKTRFDP